MAPNRGFVLARCRECLVVHRFSPNEAESLLYALSEGPFDPSTCLRRRLDRLDVETRERRLAERRVMPTDPERNAS